jgi:hypothetical protein
MDLFENAFTNIRGKSSLSKAKQSLLLFQIKLNPSGHPSSVTNSKTRALTT